MPAKTEKQRRFIWAIRRKYGTRKNAPKKWKWVFKDEWGRLAKESHIFSFTQFNEAMGTLSKDDTEIIEDLILDFVETYKISSKQFSQTGYYQIQRFDKFFIHLSFQIAPFETKEEKELFESDLNKILNRIEKFGFNVLQGAFGSEWSNRLSYTFQVSHTDEKSEEILGYTNESFLPRKEHYRILKTVKALVGIN